MAHTRSSELIIAGLLACLSVACGPAGTYKDGSPIEVTNTETVDIGSGTRIATNVPQSVPEPLVRQVAQAMNSSAASELLGFLSQGLADDGRERFTVVRRNPDGEQRASVIYDHAAQLMQGCIGEDCKQASADIEFLPTNPDGSVVAMTAPSPACAVLFYMDAHYSGPYDCYSLNTPSSTGIWYVAYGSVYTHDQYSSHKTYDQLCRDQGISTCTQLTPSGRYIIDVQHVMVYKHANFEGYDRQLGDQASDYDHLHWCDLCGDINDKVSSFVAKVSYSEYYLTEYHSGSLAQGEQRYIGAYPVASGSLFKVTMTGSGDPDLYVRFGAWPTTTAYDCRPYSGGASETCYLTVPSGQSSAYVMVRGYTSSTYNLRIDYVPQ